MIKNINISEQYLHNPRLRKEHAEQYQLTQKNIEKIKRIALKQIRYPEFKEAYEYVDNIFPAVNVKNVVIYKVAAMDMAKMGYAEVEGFYDPVTKIVVICGARKKSDPVDRRYHVEAKVDKDEIIVHELCHYCYIAEGHRSISSEMREEFAYGWSIGYLRQKGHSDEYIIKYNFLPYLMNICYNDATIKILAQNEMSPAQYNSSSNFKKKEFNRSYGKKVFLLAKEMGTERGWKLLNAYSKKIEDGEGYVDIEEDRDRFSMLDFS